MSSDLEALKMICHRWDAELTRMREELVRAERLFSEAMEDHKARIAFVEGQLKGAVDAVKYLEEPQPLAEIISSLLKPSETFSHSGGNGQLLSIINDEASASSRSKRLTVYILQRAKKPLRNIELVEEHDRLGLKVGPSAEEIMRSDAHEYGTLAKAQRRSFTLKWGLIRKAFDPRVIKLDNNTYWLRDHPHGPASQA